MDDLLLFKYSFYVVVFMSAGTANVELLASVTLDLVDGVSA